MVVLATGGSERTCLLNDEDEEVLSSGAVWRRSGDVGRVDGEGNVFCLGRDDRQIKRHGKRLDLDTLEKVGFIRKGTATVALWLRRPPREQEVMGSIPGRVMPKTLKLAF